MNYEFAILYLETPDLRVVKFNTKDECKTEILRCVNNNVPHTVLRWRERYGRYCWSVQETKYCDYSFAR